MSIIHIMEVSIMLATISTMDLSIYASLISLSVGAAIFVAAQYWLHRIDRENRRIPAARHPFDRLLLRTKGRR
jgi:hypothetical protein